ncbi:hypothetical protein FRX31_011010, partial [Thalictrum thalictroides]
ACHSGAIHSSKKARVTFVLENASLKKGVVGKLYDAKDNITIQTRLALVNANIFVNIKGLS